VRAEPIRGELTMTRAITQLYIDWNDIALENLTQTKKRLQVELGIKPETERAAL